jgi:hypothetical protein
MLLNSIVRALKAARARGQAQGSWRGEFLAQSGNTVNAALPRRLRFYASPQTSKNAAMRF